MVAHVPYPPSPTLTLLKNCSSARTWLTKVKPQLKALAQVSSKPSSLAWYRRFADTVLATYDAMWAEVSKPRWANARFRLYCGKQRVVASFWSKVKKQAQKRWPDRILALAYGAAGFNGTGTIGCRGVPVSQMQKEAVKQFRPGRVVLVDEFRTSRVSSADNTPSETLLDTPPESLRCGGSKSAVWGSLKELIDDDKSGGMHPVSREHGEHQEPGSVKSPTSDMAGREKSLDWRSFMNNVMHDDEDADSAAYPSAAQHHRPSTTKSLVAELQEEQAYHAEGLHELNNLVSEAGAAGKPALRGVLKGAADNRAAGSPLISKHGNAYGPTETQQFEIKMPSLDTGEWETVVHQVVWKVGRHFGFQAFNSNPKTQNLSMAEYVPASIFVASDHIISLLCKAGYVRRGPSAKDTDDERFAKALFELHTNIFYSYEQQWTKLVNLSWRTYAAQQFLDSYSYSDPRVIHGLLCELGLWFLIYSESSSMRHTPELMWFLYWCMNHSDIMLDFWHKDLPPLEP
ncbi:hypothetical protein QJQ45_017439, partial [Haematococcus lacustris]